MNQKELGELRRRFRPDKHNITHVYGCFVNANRDVIAEIEESLNYMTPEEVEKYLGLLKRALSGTLGRNLLDIEFSTRQVMEGEEHKLLSMLRSSKLQDAATRQAFYQKVIQSLELDGSNYLILLAHDAYDVPFRGKDDELHEEESTEVFNYIVCAVCPVRDCRLELGYFPGEKEFHSYVVSQIVSAPELGFLFPAFDGRSANIYNALYYTRGADAIHQEFIDAVFRTEPPMSVTEQKEAFHTALTEALEDSCSMEIVQAVHEQLREKITEHKESKNPEPLTVTAMQIGDMLRECGVPTAQADVFEEKCGVQFGADQPLKPANLIDAKKFEVRTPEVTVSVDPASSHLIETRVIDGRKYLLIPVDAGVEVNGLAVGLAAGDKE